LSAGPTGIFLVVLATSRRGGHPQLDFVREPARSGLAHPWRDNGEEWSGIVTSFMASGYGVLSSPPSASFLMAGWRAGCMGGVCIGGRG
jgi:hypothetical protein